jgi:hypothetical protein
MDLREIHYRKSDSAERCLRFNVKFRLRPLPEGEEIADESAC